jgi:mono/diheme cytochrome c family protein
MKEYKPFFLATRLENRILIGVAAITATIIVAGWIAINENARMEEFTERANARSVEAGARIFESNCIACHGPDGRGLPGAAPALNSPHLFGYDFFGEIDSQILVVENDLANSIGEEREALQVELSTLQAERLVLEERILYDYSDRLAQIESDLAALDSEIEMLEGVDNASRIPVYISQRESAELFPLETELVDLETRGALTEEQIEAAAEAEDAEATSDEEAVQAPESDEAEEVTDEETEAADVEATSDDEAALEEGEEEEDVLTIEEVLADFPNLTGAEAERYIEIAEAIEAFTEEMAPYNALANQRADLVAERGRFLALADAQEEVVAAREALAEVESQLAELGEAPEEGEEDPDAAIREPLLEAATEARGVLEDAELERIDAHDALLDSGDILDYDPGEPSRLAQLDYAGGLRDFIKGTLTGGRPTSQSYWPRAMVGWSQVAGGPLRVDQIDNLVDYILNWDREFTIEDIRNVTQFARVPAFGDLASDDPLDTPNVAAIQQGIAERLDSGDIVEGDAALGEAAFENFGCVACHSDTPAAGPTRTGLWTRVIDNEDDRLTVTGYEEEPEAYLIQSIVNPSAFVVPGFADGVMPNTFADRVGYQDIVNIIAFLETQE